MILIGASLSLLVIYAGVKLLIQCKKEILGNAFKYAAWFFILSGFLILAGAGVCCIAKCCKYGARMMYKEHKKSGHMGGDYEKMDHHMMHKYMIYDHHSGEENCMRHANCCGNAENAKCGNGSSCMRDSTCKK